MSATRLFFRSALVLAFVLVTASLVAPNSAIERVHELRGIGDAALWLSSAAPGLDLDHLAAFAAVGFLAPLAGVRPRFGTAALALLAFAVLTELAQGLVPGRSPQVSDLVLDVLGGGLGYLMAYGFVGPSALTPALSRREREEYQGESA